MIENFDEEFLAFAKTKSGPYLWQSAASCALGQFVSSKGYHGATAGYYVRPTGYRVRPTNEYQYYNVPNEYQFHHYPLASTQAAFQFAFDEPHIGFTWEGLVRRLEYRIVRRQDMKRNYL